MQCERGLFIVLEGVEGAGKTTQLSVAQQALETTGQAVIRTREPGGTPLAEACRDLVLADWDESVPAVTELLLMFAARSAHLQNKILPALNAGQHVLCDRFTDASFAYQGAGRGIPTAHIEWLEQAVQGDLRPDLVIVLDLDVEQAMERVAARAAQAGDHNRFDREAESFFERTRQVYLQRAAAHPQRYAVIDASADIPAVSAAVQQAIHTRLAA